MNFEQTLQRHLNAIKDRNLDEYEATVSTEKPYVVLPDGTLLKGHQAIIDWHRDWFSDPDWRIEVNILHVDETKDTGLALATINYDDIDPQGNPYHKKYYLSLGFAQQAGEWKLIHDQNTYAKD